MTAQPTIQPQDAESGGKGRAQFTSRILVVGVTLEHDFQPQSLFGCFESLQSFLQRKSMGDQGLYIHRLGCKH